MKGERVKWIRKPKLEGDDLACKYCEFFTGITCVNQKSKAFLTERGRDDGCMDIVVKEYEE